MKLLAPVFILAMLVSFQAPASVIINGTRVVYPAQSREVTVQLNNDGQTPSLVQAWVDGGDPKQTPETSDAPFALTPPISRVEPGKGQSLRVFFSGKQSLPTDRESLFWLNVLEIPPTPEAGGGDAPENYLQLAFRSRIKLFYRPQGLEGQANDAPQRLRWSLGNDGVLTVSNPTPYYVTLVSVETASGDDKYSILDDKGLMLAPGRSQAVAGRVSAGTTQVAFTSINDYGGQVRNTSSLGH